MVDITEHTMEIGSLKLFYRKMGQGRPVILLHGGWATGKLNWSNHYDTLSRQYQVFSPDHRGHGNSNNPTATFSTYGNLAWEIISFIENLNLDQKPIVIGHSSGALISLHISIFQPDLLAAQVLIGVHRNIGVSSQFKRGMEQFFCTDDFRNPPSKLKYVLNNPLWSAALWHAHRAPWFELLCKAWPMWIKPLSLVPDDYQKISIPTQLICGSHDEFGSLEDVEDLQKAIPGACLEVVENSDHMFVVNDPEALRNKLLPFLDGIS